MGLLGDFYSALDTKKRQLKGLLADPAGTLDMGVSRFREDQQGLQNLFANAYPMAGDKTVLNSPQQIAQFQGEAADKAGEMGLAGTIAGKFEYPQGKALETAQRNAAMPVSKGGLGLAADNTPMDRAKAMGFEDGWSHGSPDPTITAMRPSGFGAEGPGAYATNYAPEASTYSFAKEGSTVYPLSVNRSKTVNTGSSGEAYAALGAESDIELLSKLKARGADSITSTQPKTAQWLVDAGAPYMPERQHFASANPANFRSRFAAFDPARRNESDLLGRATPGLLQLLAGGTAGGLLGYNALKDQR